MCMLGRLHVRARVGVRVCALAGVVIHIHFDTTCITKSKSSILVVKNKTIHIIFLHNLFECL